MAQTYDNYFKEYYKSKCKKISLTLSKDKDADIIKELEGKNIQGTIKELMREGMRAREE
jgi:beta-lactam-binding protein with PASTA domain